MNYEKHKQTREGMGLKPMTQVEYYKDYRYYNRRKTSREWWCLKLAGLCFRLSKWNRRKGFQLIRRADKYYLGN